MPTAVIIGLSYSNNSDLEPLQCTLADLYRVYKWCKARQFTTYIISDLTIDDNLEQEAKLLIEEQVFSNHLLEFIEYLRNYYLYVESAETFHHALGMIPKSNKMLMYFSGHGMNGKIALPGTPQSISSTEFKQIVEQMADELFVIFDCCYPPMLDLPYRVDDTSKKYHGTMTSQIAKITLLTSCTSYQKASSTIDGSVFTQRLCENLTLLHSDSRRHNCLNLYKLTSDMQLNEQTPQILSTYEGVPLLPSWLGPYPNIAIVYSDELLCIASGC